MVSSFAAFSVFVLHTCMVTLTKSIYCGRVEVMRYLRTNVYNAFVFEVNVLIKCCPWLCTICLYGVFVVDNVKCFFPSDQSTKHKFLTDLM